MSKGGDGVIDTETMVEAARLFDNGAKFITRRFQMGGKLNISDSTSIKSTLFTTCVLCGGIIHDKNQTQEHPLPQWLHRYAGDVNENKAEAFRIENNVEPTWRQLCLASHSQCNAQFARKIEDPAKSAVTSIVEGGRVTSFQLDLMFDWLDKVKSASSHMGVALRGHDIRMKYSKISFPNRRIGAFDRVAIFFRVDDVNPSLDLWDCLDDAFLSTPSVIILKIKDLIVVYVSANYLLSSAFGLGICRKTNGITEYVPGNGVFAAGFGTRFTRIPIAKVIAQPMRRQQKLQGLIDNSMALHQNGDGKLYELIGSRWIKIKSIDFSDLSVIPMSIGYPLCALEAAEWTILCKEQDYNLYGNSDSFFMESYFHLLSERDKILKHPTLCLDGVPIPYSDRV